MAGAKFHRFIRLEQERLAELRYHASMAKIYRKPMLAVWLRFRCARLERWLSNNEHILDEPIDKPEIQR